MSVPLGPILYRIAYQPFAKASILVLFIASIAVHYILMGFALIFFGGEGFRARPLIDAKVNIATVQVAAQSVLIIATSLLIMLALYLIFENLIYGKALRATAMNRLGAALVGIPTTWTGYLTFLIASFIGAISGVLIAPTTTIYYDTGFLIALKGFVGAILGGMGSYPFAVIGSTVVGLIESFSSFWASVFKEVIVFTMIIPILAWLSMRSVHIEDEEEN
jgi:branched-chain amino acid transport system permease protein